MPGLHRIDVTVPAASHVEEVADLPFLRDATDVPSPLHRPLRGIRDFVVGHEHHALGPGDAGITQLRKLGAGRFHVTVVNDHQLGFGMDHVPDRDVSLSGGARHHLLNRRHGLAGAGHHCLSRDAACRVRPGAAMRRESSNTRSPYMAIALPCSIWSRIAASAAAALRFLIAVSSAKSSPMLSAGRPGNINDDDHRKLSRAFTCRKYVVRMALLAPAANAS